MSNIELGDEVSDRVTGFRGVVVAITHWLNGCIRVYVQPRELDKDGKIQQSETFDVEQIDFVASRVVAPCAPSGGPTPTARRTGTPGASR